MKEKRIVALFLAICIMFSLVSCAKTEIINNVDVVQPENSTEDLEKTESTSVIEEELSSEVQSTTQSTTSSVQQNSLTTQSSHTHNYSKATCTKAKTCSCGATAGTALGHNYLSATCSSPKICSRCGATNGIELGHNYSDATCTSAKKCSRCGAIFGSALGHNYVNNKCSRCGKTDPDSLPVSLNKVYLIDSQHYEYKSGTFTDSFGNKYNGVHLYKNLYDSGNGREAYSIFNLNGEYSKFTGSIVAAEDTYAKGSYYVNVYVDNVLVYSKTGITKTTGKINFNIDVKGAEQISIRVGHEQTLTSSNEKIGIVNAQLTK